MLNWLSSSYKITYVRGIIHMKDVMTEIKDNASEKLLTDPK